MPDDAEKPDASPLILPTGSLPFLENMVIYGIIGLVLICGGSAWILMLLLFVNYRSPKKKENEKDG